MHLLLIALPSSALAAPPVTDTEGVGLCTASERPRLACTLKNGKLVSLCQDKERLVYRFGVVGKVELELPEAGQPPIDVASFTLGEDERTHVANAWNKGYRYAVVSHRTEDQFDLSVVVRKGAAEKPLSTLTCAKTLGVDFTETESFVADPARVESFVGNWSGGAGNFRIEADGDSLLLKDGMAFWEGSMPGQVHTGEAEGPLKRVDPKHLRLEKGECTIDLKFESGGHLDVDDNLRCGGMNVTFSGSYTRTP